MKTYRALVKLPQIGLTPITIQARSIYEAKAKLEALYGRENVTNPTRLLPNYPESVLDTSLDPGITPWCCRIGRMAGTTEAGDRQEGDPNLACGQADRILQPAHRRRRNTCQSGHLPHTLAGSQFLPSLLDLGFAKRRPTEPDTQAPCRSLTP